METKTAIPVYKTAVKELRKNLAQMLPAEALETFDTDAEAMQAAYHPVVKLQPGDKAPDFSLSNAKGEIVRLSALLKKGKVVIVFYRGAWCPYCNLQLSQYQSALDDIKSLDAQLVAISPQNPDSSLSLSEKNALAFEVLSDNGNMVARQYTTVFKLDDAPLKVLSSLGVDFDSFYTDDSKEIPVPAVFVIQQNGLVSFAQSTGGDFRNRVEAADILKALLK